jgi:hypothetical protein
MRAVSKTSFRTQSARRRTMGAIAASAAVAIVAGTGIGIGGVALAGPSAGTAVVAPMVCSKGPGGKTFSVSVSVPQTVAPAATYDVRLDGIPTGKISGFGLRYTHDITVDYLLPAGASFVEGSARVVPGTGTPNVSEGARVSHEGNLVRMVMPGRVDSGTGYTAPTVVFQLTAKAPPGASIPIAFSQYRVTANAIVVGDVDATCEPTPKPYTLGTTVVAAPAATPTPAP